MTTPGEDNEQVPSALVPLKAEDTVLVEAVLREELPTAQPVATQGPEINRVPATGQPAAAAVAEGTAAQQAARAKLQAEELSKLERETLKALITQIHERNPYALDRDGLLRLPGFAPIALAGLNGELAGRRVNAEPALLKLAITVTRLPLAKSGVAGLKPFGYDYFDEAPSTFAPGADIAVPGDYVVGAGDVLSVQLYGNQNRTLSLTVQRDGRVSFPQLGPIAVGGLRFNAVRTEIEGRVARQLVGTRANVNLTDGRAIRVFVVGEAKYPGAYTVSGLATVTGALFAAGGVRTIGSLRNIQVKRGGKPVRTLDLYELLQQGDTSNDISLQSGDAILIPPAGTTVTVAGEVRRPAIYELKGDVSAGEAVQLAGGFTPAADQSRAALATLDDQSRRVVVDVQPGVRGGRAMRNGDVLRIPGLRPTLDSGVTLEGEFYRPGSFAWREGLRLSDVVTSVNELRTGADQHYLLIRREGGPDRDISAMSADLTAALAAPGGAADVLLQPRDRIMAFDIGANRERLVKPLINELKLEAGPGAPARVVTVNGRVKAPGDYPLDSTMRVADLVRAGGGLEDAAYGGRAELSRYVVESGEVRRAQVIPIDLAAALRGEPEANLPLLPSDGLFVREISNWPSQDKVVLKGEVRFPGSYPIKRGDTLHSVIVRAGGLTEQAFPEGSVFAREELREREQEQLDRLAERVRNDLATSALSSARANQSGAQQAYSIGQNLLDQLKSVKAVGRLVIDMPLLLSGPAGSPADIMLRNGDELVVPKTRQEVTVMGEVQNVTSHVFTAARTRDDYIALSGGTTRQADRSKVYVVRADGSVVANNTGWLFRAGQPQIHTGDTIVVPLDTERTPALPLWQAVTQIVYNLTVALAALKTF